MPKVAGKVDSGQGKKQRIFKRQPVRGEGQHFDAHGDQVHHFAIAFVHVLQEKHSVVSLHVVEENHHTTVVTILVHGKSFHVTDKMFRACRAVMRMTRVRFEVS